MLNLLRSLIPDSLLRAQVLKGLRWASTAAGAWVLTSTYVWLTTHVHSMSQADAATIAGTLSAAAAGLILAVGSWVFSMLDAKKVDNQVKATQASTALTVAAAVHSDPEMGPAIASQAVTALAQGDGASKQLAQTIATLKAGQA